MSPLTSDPMLNSSLTAPKTGVAAGSNMDKTKIMAAAKDFESVFATQMLTHMYETVKVDDTFGGGHGEEMFRTVLLDEYGKEIGRNDSMGIARQIADTMLKIQEGANGHA